MSNNFDGLSVEEEELRNVENEIKRIQNEFKDLNNQFKAKIKELGSYWSGADYNAMVNNVKKNMEPITDEEGSINNLINDMTKGIENNIDRYVSIHKKNMGYWG